MIHFRLRRSLRLAVDILSLGPAKFLDGTHPCNLFFRESRANISAVILRHGVLRSQPSSPCGPRCSESDSSKPAFIARPRRYLPFCALLLAISLEVCGCETQSISSLTPDTTVHDSALQESARGDQTLAFYDPGQFHGSAESADGITSLSLPGDDTLVDAKSVLADTRPQPWAIPESVYFVYRGHRPDRRPPRQPPIATAFVLSVPDRARSVRFLVTARHVVDPQWAHCSDQNPASIDIRLIRRSGGVGYETVPLRSNSSRSFYTPLDPTADIAVIPLDQRLIPDIEDYKFIDVPFQLLLSDSEMPLIRVDQQVITARPSARPSGELNNYLVFDGGILSTLPPETVGVRCGLPQTPEPHARIETRMLHVWFIDAGVQQGVSGAPVYTSIARVPGAAETRVLLGIQSVAWPERGMAGITPSPALGDLIRSAMRDSKLNLAFDRVPTP